MNNLHPNRQFVSIDITSDYNLYFHSWPKLFDTIGLIFFIISYAGFIINRFNNSVNQVTLSYFNYNCQLGA